MAEQETLHNGDPVWKPETHGLYKRFLEGLQVDSPYIDHGAINLARSSGTFVGTCRDCGGNLRVMPSQDPLASEIPWTDFLCDGCGKETASPDTRRLHRTSSHNRMPQGWWAKRYASIKARTTLRSS